jgi:hypothetical protein
LAGRIQNRAPKLGDLLSGTAFNHSIITLAIDQQRHVENHQGGIMDKRKVLIFGKAG